MSTPSLGTARPPMTRPRLSQLTLEGAAGLASTMLLAWLLLWFVTKVPRSTPIFAVLDPNAGFDVPYLEADRLEIAGPKGKRAADEDALQAVKLASGTAVVISIAGPTKPGDSKATLDRIGKVASTAKRNVLILLDQAQVDNDPEGGVFGNAPYLGLASALKGMKVTDPKASIFVLCSAAPGQKSWMIDGQGRSAFAYFVQLGLASKPPLDGDPGRKGIDRLDDLVTFVRRNVQGWVKDHRRDATQTPMLLAVGERSKPFSLPPVKLALPGQTSAPVDPKADAKTTADPAKAARKTLADRWREHDELADDAPAPYRFAPAAWRVYESALLRAERLVRSASNDPTLQADADQALEFAADRKKELSDKVAQARKKDREFPIQPASADPAGRRALVDSVKSVSGQILEIDDPSARPMSDPPLTSVRKSTDVAEGKPVETPRELKDAATLGRPARYLELQLPAWALTFQEAFPFNSFHDPGRSYLFMETAQKRMRAEEAIALDRRGRDWIAADIRKGDEIRRAVQDDLFGPIDDESISRLKGQIVDFDRAYVAAWGSAELYRDSRALFEKIAARLPYLGEWAVLDSVAASSDPYKLPDRLEKLLVTTGKLNLSLAKPGEVESLRVAREEAGEALELVEADYRKRFQDANLGGRWRDIDDVLVTPLIPWQQRQKLVDRVTNPTIDGPAPSPIATDERDEPTPKLPSDTGFRRRSAGLAMLDYRLRALSGDEPAEPLKKARDEIARSRDPKDDPLAIEAALAPFADYTSRIDLLRKDVQTAPDPKEEVTEARLAQADQEVRFLRAAELSSDQPAVDLEEFAQYTSILFQAERLGLDNARNVQSLRDEAARSKFAKKLKPPASPPFAVLSIDVTPEQVTIDKDSHDGRFEAVLKGDLPGRAFVGAVPIASSSDASRSVSVTLDEPVRKGDADGPRRGGLVGKGEKPLALRVEQTASLKVEEDPSAKVAVKGFFRGHLVEDNRKAIVAVGLINFGDPVTIGITWNKAELDKTYGEKNMATVPNQFIEHQFKGFLHAKGRLDNILVFQNTTRDPLKDLVVKRTLKPSNGGEGTPTVLAPIPIKQIDAKGEVRIYYPIVAQDLAKPMDLVVEVVDSKKKPIAERTIEFQAQHSPFNQYLNVQATREFQRFNGGQRAEDCLVIHLSRSPNDPTTEPILYRDIKFAIMDLAPTNSLSEGGFLDRGGEVVAVFKILSTDKEINYKVIVEDSEKEGKYRVK